MAAEQEDSEEKPFSYLRPPEVPDALKEKYDYRVSWIINALKHEEDNGFHFPRLIKVAKNHGWAEELQDEKAGQFAELAIRHYVADRCMSDAYWRDNIVGGEKPAAQQTPPKRGILATVGRWLGSDPNYISPNLSAEQIADDIIHGYLSPLLKEVEELSFERLSPERRQWLKTHDRDRPRDDRFFDPFGS